MRPLVRALPLSLFVKWSLFLSLMVSAMIALPRFEKTPAGQRVVRQVDSVLLDNLESLSILAGVIAISLNWPDQRREQRQRLRYDAWQVIFAARGERVCDLRTQALEDLNQARLDLSELPLEGARLRGIKLWQARLEGVRLKEADLTDGQLPGANMTYGKLRRAILVNTRLTSANLQHSDLYHADLTGAHLRSANLREANLSGAHLDRACLKFADCRDANLSKAQLSEAALVGINFADADLTGAEFRDADLTRANFSNAALGGANFERANLQGIRWQDDDVWLQVTGLDSARNVPVKLKQYLKLVTLAASQASG